MDSFAEGFIGHFTYLGIEVPQYVFHMSNEARSAWRQGVSWTLSQKGLEEPKPTRKLHVVDFGDPEPYRGLKYRDQDGDVWRYGVDFQGVIGWNYDNGSISRQWNSVSGFPLTEVFE